MIEDTEIIIHFLQRLYEFPAVKFTAGIILWVVKIMFGSSFRPAYSAVICLWLFDTVSGFYYVWANPTVKPESRKFYHGLVKLTIYLFLLFLGYQCGLVEVTAFIQMMIESFIILTESYSILENLEKIAKLKEVNIPFLTRIMSVIQGKIAETEGGNDAANRRKN